MGTYQTTFGPVLQVDENGAPIQPNPILDHANGVAKAVTTSAAIFTPPTGCQFARFVAQGGAGWVRTDNAAAAKPTDGIAGGVSTYLPADLPVDLPVTAEMPCRGISDSGASVVISVVPYKIRG